MELNDKKFLLEYKEYKTRYQTIKTIGQGAFGTIYKIRNFKDEKFYANKKIKFRGSQELSRSISEIFTYKRVEHPLVIKLYYCYFTEGNEPGSMQMGLIMELGIMSLDKYILEKRVSKQYLNLKILETFTYQFIELFAQFQKQKISHRDIKPANIIITDLKKFICKITDFGLSKQYITPINSEQEFAGTFDYVSPQLRKIYQHKQLNVPCNHIKNDVYSFGITLYELAALQLPQTRSKFDMRNLRQIYGDVYLIQLIQKMLSQKQQTRPTFLQMHQEIRMRHMQKIEKMVQQQKIQQIQYKININQIQKVVRQQQQIQPTQSTKKEVKIWKLKSIQKLLSKVFCMCSIDDIIMFGCENGKIKIFFDKKIVEINNSHSSQFPITVLKKVNNHVWSAGCDSRIFVWDIVKLKQIIIKQDKQTLKKSNLFHTYRYQIPIINNPGIYEQIKRIPIINHGISSIDVLSQKTFAIGYYDGYVYIQNNDKKMKKMIQATRVTCLKFHDKYLYSCSDDGMLKKIDIQKMELQNNYFKCNSTIQQLIFTEDSIKIFCENGLVYIISYQFHTIDKYKIANSEISTCFVQDENCFSIVDNKSYCDLMQNKIKIFDLQSQGISCLYKFENQINIVTFEGELFKLSLEVVSS